MSTSQGKRVDGDISKVFYICGSVHHKSILLNNQRDAAYSSRIYS
jgi:hypothetical protein